MKTQETLPSASASPASSVSSAPKSGNGKRGGIFSPLVIDGLAAVSSIGAGLVMAWREILSESYANFTDMKLIDHIKKKHRGDFGPDLVRQLETGAISAEEAANKILANNVAYHKEVASFMQENGFGSNTWAGFKKRCSLLSSHESWKIGLTAGAVTAVSLGSLLLLTKGLFAERSQNTDAEQGKSR